MDDEGFFCLPPTLQYFTNFSVHMYLYNNNKDKKKEEEEETKNFEGFTTLPALLVPI